MSFGVPNRVGMFLEIWLESVGFEVGFKQILPDGSVMEKVMAGKSTL